MDRQKGEGYTEQSGPEHYSYSQSDDSSKSNHYQQNHARSFGSNHPWDATDDHQQSDEDDRFHNRHFNLSNGEQSNSPGVWEDSGYSVPVSGRKRDFHQSAQPSPQAVEGGLNSQHKHNNYLNSLDALINVPQHSEKVLNGQSYEEIQKDRLPLRTMVESIRWLTLQGCALRGYDEVMLSTNQDNLSEMIKFMGDNIPEIGDVVLENAHENAKFTSPTIQKELLHILASPTNQKELLHILANKVRKKIREEIGDAKFCCLVNEIKGLSSKELVAIVLRFVDVRGFVRERLFDIVNVTYITATNLKYKICDALSRFNLDANNLRGQCYDSEHNACNGIHMSFLRDCPSAYYVHCFVHRLQPTLVAAAGKEASIWLFFSKLTTIVNLVSAYAKRHNELQSKQANEIVYSIALDERETTRVANQIDSLYRVAATGWSSHFESICGLIDMYEATSIVLENIVDDMSFQSERGEAFTALIAMGSFEFIFILYTMYKIMAITDLLSQVLQQKNVDILSAMEIVSSTKGLLGVLRCEGFDLLMDNVKNVCTRYDIHVPDMSAHHRDAISRSCQQRGNITIEHHYHFDIFNNAIDFQLQELNDRFSDDVVELLKLSSSLDPQSNFKSFNIKNICTLAEFFYPNDFSGQEMHSLRSQLAEYEIDIIQHHMFQGLSTLSDLCQKLVETRKSQIYFLIEKLIRLILTLPISAATTERAFSAMKYIEFALCNEMEEEFLEDSMIVYVEREFSQSIDVDSVIDEFYSQKLCRCN